MAAAKDMTGQQFGRLNVLRRNGANKHGQARWLCVCRCGAEITANGFDLRGGHSKSCGCLRLEVAASSESKHHTHSLSDTAIYAVWRSMHARCSNPRHKSFQHYGARGIVVCEQWSSFEQFHADFGASRPSPRHTMDRIRNEEGYEPGNVQWSLPVAQCNNRRSNVLLTHDGETMTIAQWARRANLSAECFASRLRAGWPMATAIALRPDSGQRVMKQRAPA